MAVSDKPPARPPLPIRILTPIFIPLPEILLLILITTVLSSTLNLSGPIYNIPVLGKISVGEDQGSLFDFPIHPWKDGSGDWGWIRKTTGTSVFVYFSSKSFPAVLMTTFRMIAIIGYIDSVVAAKQNSDRFGYSVSSNREWVALG